VLGADGAKSACRKLLGIPYLGDTFKPEMYLSDFELHNPPKEHHVETHLWADKALAMIPVTKDTIRLISNVQDYVSLVPKHLQLGKELWKSSFRVNHRTAQTFQK
jgi:2-polyprenyl-6-methoxyphenol hydroxylase-like FAD-dependent oxidoreductase